MIPLYPDDRSTKSKVLLSLIGNDIILASTIKCLQNEYLSAASKLGDTAYQGAGPLYLVRIFPAQYQNWHSMLTSHNVVRLLTA